MKKNEWRNDPIRQLKNTTAAISTVHVASTASASASAVAVAVATRAITTTETDLATVKKAFLCCVRVVKLLSVLKNAPYPLKDKSQNNENKNIDRNAHLIFEYEIDFATGATYANSNFFLRRKKEREQQHQMSKS